MVAYLDHVESEASSAAPIVAVIPAFNEERFIASVVISARRWVDHVIVVDDGSSDQTASLAHSAGSEVIRLERNLGKGAALNAGFVRAGELNASVVVTLDADSQHDPSQIPAMLTPILQDQADVVVGSRFLDRQSRIPRWRRMGQHTLTAVTNVTSGLVLSDSQSGFRAFSPKALRGLRFSSSHLAMESEMQFLMEGSGLRLLEVPITVHYLDGNKRNPIVHGLQVVDAILTLVARRRPLLFVGLPGAILVVLGVVVGFYVVSVVDSRHVVPFGTAVLSSLLIIVGLLLSVTAVILNTLDSVVMRIGHEIRSALEKQPANAAGYPAYQLAPEDETPRVS